MLQSTSNAIKKNSYASLSLSSPENISTSALKKCVDQQHSTQQNDNFLEVVLLDDTNIHTLPEDSKNDISCFNCNTPGCVFSSPRKSEFIAHMRRNHSLDRPFKCPWPNCDASFKARCKLKVHQVIHTGERPYRCNWEGCMASFNQSGHLSRHKRSHTGQRYSCTWLGCDKLFSQRHSLKIHLMEHKGEKPWKCNMDDCGRSFAEKWKLTKHLEKHKQIPSGDTS